jgi:hypothetical protein
VADKDVPSPTADDHHAGAKVTMSSAGQTEARPAWATAPSYVDDTTIASSTASSTG